jgi:hypothetical protein
MTEQRTTRLLDTKIREGPSQERLELRIAMLNYHALPTFLVNSASLILWDPFIRSSNPPIRSRNPLIPAHNAIPDDPHDSNHSNYENNPNKSTILPAHHTPHFDSALTATQTLNHGTHSNPNPTRRQPTSANLWPLGYPNQSAELYPN